MKKEKNILKINLSNKQRYIIAAICLIVGIFMIARDNRTDRIIGFMWFLVSGLYVYKARRNK